MLIYSFPSHQHSIKYCHHFIKEEHWAEGLNDLPKTTELVSESEHEPRESCYKAYPLCYTVRQTNVENH